MCSGYCRDVSGARRGGEKPPAEFVGRMRLVLLCQGGRGGPFMQGLRDPPFSACPSAAHPCMPSNWKTQFVAEQLACAAPRAREGL